MSAFRSADIYVRDRLAGKLIETDAGYEFAYHSEYLQAPDATPVSLTLPVQVQTYTSTTLFPFFDGLIPEGWLLNLVTHNWKIDQTDRFGLLLIACKDCIGNVSIREGVDT